ncbi:hypothetical protein D3C78_1941930 [compost metagenome]
MGLLDRGAIMPPQAGDVDELRVLVKQRGKSLRIAAAPGLDKGLGDAFWSVEWPGPHAAAP